jgi:hypothetical protein
LTCGHLIQFFYLLKKNKKKKKKKKENFLLFTNGEASPPILDSYAKAFQPSLSLSWMLAPTLPTLPLISSDAKTQISTQPSPCPKTAPDREIALKPPIDGDRELGGW